ncbi:peptide/nickel transport system permease protein [Ruminiclostridium sufflavum DSM 19573]|uniref:Peptide/nickel transport system permease protein n=1 Tax=Ruminiclostridium sufflavum DSM 19573 TaxID=1121337 RepID=A0A318XRP1_9FIRM|nr:ABC transporter permease [Ruminiclostridium sufflavum]PYG90257.1 peptide/nickel transport system permease protein [Ruminiclostridium sufflavum DSM 19573]
MKNKINIILPAAVILFCLFGFLLAAHNPKETNIMNKFMEPALQYPFGTDELGRCVFSRVLWGGWVTIGIVLAGSAIVAVFGSIIGLLLGQSSSVKNLVMDSLLNAVTAIPPIAYLIIFIGIWGNSIPTMLVALTASLILRMIKLVKTLTEVEMEKAYIMCAVSCGAGRARVLFVHILPNIIKGGIIHFLCLSCAEMIMAISGFSFIGLSLGDDVIDWGTMLASARNMIGMRPMLLFYPIFFIFLSTVSFNLLGKQLEKGETANA